MAQAVVLEHQEYLEAVRELTDWLMTAGEELQHWSDSSGDSASIKRKLSEVRVRRHTDFKCHFAHPHQKVVRPHLLYSSVLPILTN